MRTLSKSHIDVIVTEKDGVSWRLTGIYGHIEKLKRIETWNLMRLLHQQVTLPWICIGDFNEILLANEKQGGEPRSEWQMVNFREVLDNCRLRDMGFKGARFIWCNRKDEQDRVYVRLDRRVANQEWYDLFPHFDVHHLRFSNSDHMAIGVQLRRQSQSLIRMYKKRFRFEEAWVKDEGYEEAIANAWFVSFNGSLMFQVCNKIKECRKRLLAWSKNSLSSLGKKIEEKRNRLQVLEENNRDASWVECEALRHEISILIEKEEIYWKQRSRISWLREGDRNTKFFHAKASARRKKNLIVSLKEMDGTVIELQSDIERVIIQHFSTLFQSSNPNAIEEVVAHIPKVVTEEMNDWLVRDFHPEEV